MVTTAAVLTCDADFVTHETPDKHGVWAQVLEEMTVTDLALAPGQEGTASAKVLRSHPKTAYQIKLTRKDGTEWFSPRALLEVTPLATAATAPPPTDPAAIPKPRVEPNHAIRPNSGMATAIRVHSLATDSFVDGMVWSNDGNHLFAATKAGMLQKFDVQTKQAILQVDLQARCSFLGKSKEGLVLKMDALQQVWLVHEDSLQVMHKIQLPTAAPFACSPASSLIYFPKAHLIVSVDLRTGVAQLLRVFLGKDVNAFIRSEFRTLAMTPNGSLFATSGGKSLMRLRTQSNKVFIEATTSHGGGSPNDITISADSRYVAIPLLDRELRGHYSYVYDIADLKTALSDNWLWLRGHGD